MKTENLETLIDQLAWIAGNKASSSIHLLKKQYLSILAKNQNLAEINSKERLFLSHGKDLTSVLLNPLESIESKLIKFHTLYQEQPLLIDNDPKLAIELDLQLAHNPEFLSSMAAYETFLKNEIPWLSVMTRDLVDLFVPAYLKHSPALNFSISSHNFKGALFIKLRQSDPLNFISLAHETAHQMLMIYLLSDPVIQSDHKTLIYSAARNQKRQAIRSMHSLFAVTYEIFAQVSLLKSNIISQPDLEIKIKESFKANVEKYLNNLNDLNQQCEFTPLGKVMMDEFQQLSKEFTGLLATDPV